MHDCQKWIPIFIQEGTNVIAFLLHLFAKNVFVSKKHLISHVVPSITIQLEKIFQQLLKRNICLLIHRFYYDNSAEVVLQHLLPGEFFNGMLLTWFGRVLTSFYHDKALDLNACLALPFLFRKQCEWVVFLVCIFHTKCSL